jgi:hypothetical protein
MTAYRKFRWSVSANRAGTTELQVAEFYLRDSGSTIAWPSGTTATDTSAAPASPGGEGADKLIDGNTSTKFLNWGSGTTWQVTFDCQANTEAKGYSFVTGNDAPERDPIAWTFEGQVDGGSTWDLLDTQSPGAGGITTARTTVAGVWDYESGGGGGSGFRAGYITG